MNELQCAQKPAELT